MDLFTHRCGCGRILGRLEQCVSCTDKRRVEAIATAGPRGTVNTGFYLWVDLAPKLQPAVLLPAVAKPIVIQWAAAERPMTFEWASAEHAAKAAESTARYQARHVKAKR